MTAYTSSQSGLASASSTWGGAGHPSADADTFTIQVGHVVTWDLDLSGLTNGLGICTINGGLEASTVAGTYGFKRNGAWTVSATGHLYINNGLGNPYPTNCTFKHVRNAAVQFFLAASSVTDIRCAEPVHTYVKVTASVNSATQTIDTDLTGEPFYWAAGQTVQIQNAAVSRTNLSATILSLTSTTITFTGAVNLLAGAIIVLSTRNITDTGTLSADIGWNGSLAANTIYIAQAASNFANDTYQNFLSATIGGVMFGNNEAAGSSNQKCTVNAPIISSGSSIILSWTGSTFNGPLAGSSSSLVNTCTSCTFNGPLIGAGVNGVGSSVACTFNSTISYCATGANISHDCQFAFMPTNCSTAGITGCINATIHNGTGSTANSTDLFNVVSGQAYGVTFSAATQFSGYNDPTKRSVYDEFVSYNDGNVANSEKRWTLGGIVTSVASPVFTGEPRSYKHACETALFWVFRTRVVTVPAGGTLSVTCYAQKDTSMSYLPRLWIFDSAKEPFISGSPDVEVIMSNANDNQWQTLSGSITNSGNSPKEYRVRTLAKNASGNVYFDPVLTYSGSGVVIVNNSAAVTGPDTGLEFVRDRTSTTIFVQAFDTTTQPSSQKTGLAFNTAGLSAYYMRNGGSAAVQISLVSKTLGTWISGGFKEYDSVNFPGLYALDLPDAALATGSDGSTEVMVNLGGVTNVVFIRTKIGLKAVNTQDAVRMGLTAFPNANAESPGGMYTRGTGAGQINQDANGRIDVNWKAILGTALTETVGGYLAAGLKKLLDVATPIFTLASTNQSGDSYPIVSSGTYGNAALLTAINNINNLSALANLFGPSTLVRPSSGSIAYPFTYIVKNELGQPIDVDSNTVTLTAKNAAGTDRSANLSAVTHSGTGEYTFTYTVSSAATDEGLAITAAGTVLSVSRKAYASADIADADSLAALAAIQAQTDKLTFHGSNILADIKEWIDAAPNGLASGRVDVTVGAYPGNTAQSGDSYPRLGAPAGLSVSADIAAVKTDVDARPTNPLLTNDARLPGSGVIAKQGDKMDLVDAPNVTGIAAIWAGVTQGFFAKFFTQDSGKEYGDAVNGSVVKEIAANATTDPTSVAHAVWAYVIGGSAASDLLALLPIMWARLVGLGNNVAFSSMVSPDGKEIRFIQGDDYLLANNRPLILPLPPGFSPLTPGQAVTLGLAKVGGQTQQVTGTAVDAQTMRWDIPASVNRLMPLGRSEFSVLELTASTYRNTPYTGWAVVRKVRTSS